MQRVEHEELAEGWEVGVDQRVATADTTRILERNRKKGEKWLPACCPDWELQRSLCALPPLTVPLTSLRTYPFSVVTNILVFTKKNYNIGLAITHTNDTIQSQIRRTWVAGHSHTFDSHNTNTHFFVHSLAVVKNAALSVFNCCAVGVDIN